MVITVEELKAIGKKVREAPLKTEESETPVESEEPESRSETDETKNA